MQIAFENIHKSFATQKVLDGVDLQIEDGCTQVLLGQSGSGKTTLLRLINGLDNPDEGQVKVLGKPLADWTLHKLRRKIGYVIQNAGLFPHLNVFDNIATVPRLLGWSKETIERRSHELLEKLHLSPVEFSQKYPAQLSGGEMQRVGLARALAADPPILLMDEPFGALDPFTRHEVMNEFIRLEELQTKTVVLVTHNIRTAFQLGDRVALIEKGTIAANQSPEQFLKAPVAEAVKPYLQDDILSLKLLLSERLKPINEQLLSGKELKDRLLND